MKNSSWILLIALALSSCGGGGGGAGNPKFLGGVYSGSLSSFFDTSASCPGVPTNEPFDWTVNQNGSHIVLDSATHQTYTGAVVTDQEFVVSKTNVSGGCTGTTTADLTKITDTSADVSVQVTVACPKGSCEVTYSGTATRSMT